MPEKRTIEKARRDRRVGVSLPPPAKGTVKERAGKSAQYAYEAGQRKRKTRRQPRVAHAVVGVLKPEPRRTASHAALSQHAKQAVARRSPSGRSAAAQKAVWTKGYAVLSAAALKAVLTKLVASRSAAARKAARTSVKRQK